MDFSLSDDQREIKRTARELLAERASPARVREHAEARRFDEGLWRELCELGWPGIAISERYGGQGLGCVELSILCEELGRALAPVPFLPSVLASTLIEQAGSEEQRERVLPALASGEQRAAVGVAHEGRAELVIGAREAQVLVLLESPDGSAAERGAASARVLDASEAEVALVTSIDPTRSTADVTASVLAGEALTGERAEHELTGERRRGDPRNGELTDGRPEEGLQGGLDRAQVALCSELVGVCDRALEMTVAYVKERRQFGVPVGAFQAVSHRCAQMLLETEQARSLTAQAAWAADAEPALLPEATAMAKAAAADAGVHVTGSAIQAHGGVGFTWEADVHWLYKRAHIDAALLGGAKFQRARLASLVTERVRAHTASGEPGGAIDDDQLRNRERARLD